MNVDIININIIKNCSVIFLIIFAIYKILQITSRLYFPQQRISEGNIYIITILIFYFPLNF